jgi:predicted helicase
VQLYDTFFATAFKKTVDKLGIVYTPVEIVDFILRSADDVLREHFGHGLTDEGVHILDGFVGTGTFIVRLLQLGLITPEDLPRKYAHELHANEILLLAYYIAAVNIETTYFDVVRGSLAYYIAAVNIETTYFDVVRGSLDSDAPYEPFPGLILTDTFQSWEDDDRPDLGVFPENNERLERLKALDIQVIVGNPPYSSGQDSANDNNANEKYPALDAAIRDTYAARSTATNKNSLYDSYIRAIKWATLRIKDRGVIAYVTNGGWLDSNTADGMRLSLADEFTDIYVLNLRGNQRTAGEQSRKEGGKVFGGGSRATVAVTLLVKDPAHPGPARIHYSDIGDYLSREQKLAKVVSTGTVAAFVDETIEPNFHGDWTRQRNPNFSYFSPIGEKTDGSLFDEYGPGLQTNRDAWVYNASRDRIRASLDLATKTYAEALAGNRSDDPTLIKWSSSLESRLARRDRLEASDGWRLAAYRPFERSFAVTDMRWVHRPGVIPRVFPEACENRGYYVLNPGAEKPFSVLMVDVAPDPRLLRIQCWSVLRPLAL